MSLDKLIKEAYAGDEIEFGRELVELADELISSGKVHSPGVLLTEVLSKAGVMAPAHPLGVGHINPTSPAALFDAFTSDKLPGLREYFTQFFEVVALPCSRIDNDLQPGDCLVRRALGEDNLAHLSLLVTGEVFRAKDLAFMGLQPESPAPGLYAEIIDAGPFPHRLQDTFARRLGNENGLSHDSLIFRIFEVDRSSAEIEMAASEDDVAELGPVTEDFSLRQIADGTLGKLPDDILAAILTSGESDAKDLTDRVFWRNHPDLSGTTLDPKAKDRKQQALREEWGRILRRQVKPIIWLRQLIDQLDRHWESIPREFLLGWMAVESDGKVSTVSTLGERGYFQIMWESGEAKSQLGLTENGFLRLSTDREFSIEKGVQLAKTYRQYFLKKYPSVSDGSDLLWRLTKGRHALPTALDKVLDRLVKAGTMITWQLVSHTLPKMASGVNFTLDYAAKLKPLADRVPSPVATTPEFYSESALWFPGRNILPFEPGMLQEQPGNAPKCGFHGPNGAFVIEADLRAAVVTAALDERKIWWVGTGNTAQKEDNDKRFGDLVRYWLAGHTGTIRPGKLEAVQQAALDPSVTYGNLGNATLNAAVQAFRKAAAEVDAKAADVYKKSDGVDSANVKVEAAEKAVADAAAKEKLAGKKVEAAEKRVKDARSQSGSGAQAAIDAAQAALDAERAALRAAAAALNAARKDLDDARKDRGVAGMALEAAKDSHKQAQKDRKPLKDPAQNWKDSDKRKTRRAILKKAGSTDPQKIDNEVVECLQLAHQSRADIEAWSAVFVVSCVRRAAIGHRLEAIDGSGAHLGRDGLLKASRRHSDYVVEARERRHKAVGGTYHAFEPTERAVKVGDIICTDRTDFIGKPVRLKDIEQGRLLHADIVTQVKTENGKGFAETIGGNVGHTVRRRRYPLNDTDRLIVSATELFAQEDDTGAVGSLTPLMQVPTMLAVASTGRIFALLSLVEECKPVSGIAPVGKSAKEAYAGFVPGILEEQAGNVVDADAAEPVFTGLVRMPSAPLPDVAALKKASQWNQKIHPKESGISLAELRARLEQYIDRSALDDLLRQANAGAVNPPYGSDEATMVTLLADQFQQKTCRKPSVGDIWRLPTMGGKVAEDTLDALGFIYHLGKITDLNLADQVNLTAADTLKKVKAIEFKDLEPGLTAKTWWTYMVRPPWLGMPIKEGIHLVLLKRLRLAQKFLMGLRAYENMSPAELGKVLGLEEEHKGARPRTATKSMHTFGLGIDIGLTHNPWLSNPEINTEKIAVITLRAAQFIGGKPRNQKGITAKFLHQLAVDNQDTTKIYKILSDWSNWLGSYFALATDPKRIESQLPVLNAINPDIGFIKQNESLADAAKRWTRIIKSDFDDFATAVSRGGNKEAVQNGFMNLPRDLVLALREYACLGWGAVDFGPSESGDIMHFDCRVDGIGRAIRIATGRDAPTEGHRCIPIEARKSNQGEFEEDAPKSSLSFKFISKKIPRYKDADGDPRSTSCSIFVPGALQNQKKIDVLVFFHGHDTCDPGHNFNPDKVVKLFQLDDQVDKAARKVALAVPTIYWVSRNKDKTNKKEVEENKENIRKAWSAAQLNDFVEEVLDEIFNKSAVKRNLGHLILAGHSRAYDILTPLANEFVKTVPDNTTKGALATLEKVLAMDTTYGLNHAKIFKNWADKLGTVKFMLVLSKKGFDSKKNDCKFKENDPPIKYWECAMADEKLPKNLDVKTVIEDHCRIPNEYVKTLLTFESETKYPELLGPEGDGDPATPVLHLEKVKISGLPEIILTLGSGGRYEGFFVTPIHLGKDQTSYVQTRNKEIELTGRIQIEESGTRRNYDSKKDGKEWPLAGVKGSAYVKVVNADGPNFSGAAVRKVLPDGTFILTNSFGVDGFTRSLTIYPEVELKGGKSIAATVVVELTDLDGFLALVDPKEKARPSSQSHLEFLASVRKIYQGGPKDPLSGAFDLVLYRYRNVKPLVSPDSAEDQRFKLYKDWLFADREWVDIGHVLTGIEGSPKQEPSKDQNIPVPRRPELFVTWAGDLGSALQKYIKDFWNAIDTGAPLDLQNYLMKHASRIDLIGDIDGINIGSAYDSSRPLAENLRAYYGQKSRRRYHEFIANSKDKTGKAELPLVSGKKPPQLTKQARQAIADNTKLFLDPLWIFGKLYNGTDPSKRKLIDEIVQVNSPEMDTVVEYFARFLEDGLVREP